MGSGLEELGITDDGDDDTAVTGTDASGPHPQVGASAPDPDEDARRQSVEQALHGMRLFEGLLPVHLGRIARLAREIEIPRGEHVFHHGDDGDGMYLVLDGAIRISRNVSGMGEESLAILQPGMYFGEMSIVDDAPRSADAIAHEGSRLLKLPKDDLRDLMFVDRELAYELLWRFVRTLSSRLRESNDRLLMLTVSSKF